MSFRTATFTAVLFAALTVWFFGALVVRYSGDDPVTQADLALKSWLWIVCGATFICTVFFGGYAFWLSTDGRRDGEPATLGGG